MHTAAELGFNRSQAFEGCDRIRVKMMFRVRVSVRVRAMIRVRLKVMEPELRCALGSVLAYASRLGAWSRLGGGIRTRS